MPVLQKLSIHFLTGKMYIRHLFSESSVEIVTFLTFFENSDHLECNGTLKSSVSTTMVIPNSSVIIS